MAWLTSQQIQALGFLSVGERVFISDKVSFYNCSKIILGNHVRIDDFCVISAGAGGIVIGDYVHIAVYTSLIGAEKIHISDFCGLSSRTSIYSSNDDYSGQKMTGPMVPSLYRGVKQADVFLGKHVIVGSGSVLLPGVHLGLGVAIGALSLVTRSCQEFGVYAGRPAKFIKERYRDLLHLEEKFLEMQAGQGC